jgi:N-acetylglucosamine-6-phosphate deacetylase
MPERARGDGNDLMAPQALCGARVFTGERFLEDHAVLLDGERILDVLPAASVPAEFYRHDLGGGLLAPGFVDAQVNGGGGVLFNERRTAQAATAIALAHARHGSTGLLPTFITDHVDRRVEAVAAIREAIAAKAPGILGIHLEGPFLATARKGAHDSGLIRPLTDGDVDALLDSGIDKVLLTVAAENASPRQIRQLVDGGIIVSLGHSAASYEMAAAAADAGARGVTHLYNAMSPLEHRAPGLVGAALDHGGLWAGFIADGHHAHPAALRIALRAKQGPAQLFLVSDAMPPAASLGTTFALNGRTVTRRDGKLTLEDGTLAGSVLTMDQAVKYAVDHLQQPLSEALRMASLYPAQFLLLDRDRGRIAPRFVADMVLLGDDLSVRTVWIAGVSG